VVVFKEGLSASINTVAGLLLARHLQPETFVQFTSIIFLASSVAQVNRGVQYSIFRQRKSTSLVSGFKEIKLSRLVAYQCTIWIALGCIFSIVFRLPTLPTLAAAVIFPATILSACVSGSLQAQSAFSTWQNWIFLTTFGQLPGIIAGIVLGAPLTYFVVIQSVPSILMAVAFLKIRIAKQLNPAINLAEFSTTGIYLGILFLQYNLVFISLRRLAPVFNLGSYTAFLFPMSLAVGLSALFGSFKLPFAFTSFTSGGKLQPLVRRVSSRLLCLFLLLALGIHFFVQNLAESVIGERFGGSIPAHHVLLIAFAFAAWGTTNWLAQSFIFLISSRIVLFQIALLLVEFTLLWFQIGSLTTVLAVHLGFGMLTSTALLATVRKI
jgi:hypothetical protein